MNRSASVRRADQEDRLAAAHAHLLRSVEELSGSDAWRRMLDTAARFPAYSANNVLLINVQAPEATRVAGIRTWNSLGRRVRKGETGIAILAPCLYRPREVEVGRHDRTPRAVEPSARELEPPRQLRGFRVVHVFDLAQTDGKPLAVIGPAELRGPAPGNLVQHLSAVLAEDGYAVERGPCGRAYGYTDFRDRIVRVREDVSDGQAAKTLGHELGHIRADHEHRYLATYATSSGCRSHAEVEAESIAYVVTRAAGMTTESYSVPYVAGWAGGDPELLRATATRVLEAARGIVHDLGLDHREAAHHAPTPARAADRTVAPHLDPLVR